MYTDNTLRTIQDGQAFTHEDGIKYPGNYPKDEIAGLHLVNETPKPADADLIVTGFIIDEAHTQVWQTRAKVQAELDNDKTNERRQALAAVWADPFDLLDDILERGIDAVKTDRNAIKTAHPKP